MSWRFPDKRPTNTGVMGVEDANDAALPVVEETSGRLNEMNWAENSFTTAPAEARFSKDMAYRHFRKHAFCPNPVFPSGVSNPDYYKIPLDSVWHVPFDSSGDLLSHTFDSVGGSLYICGRSFIQVDATAGSSTGIPVLMGIRVNGALIPESICGNSDIASYAQLESTGMQHWFNAMSEITIPIPPGRTTVDVVVRVRFDARYTFKRTVTGVGTRSLILWEMSR